MRSSFFPFLITLLLLGHWVTPFSLFGQSIPDERKYEWNKAGLNNQWNTPQTQISVLDFGATGNGVSDDTPAIRQAIAALNGKLGYVYLPPGDYRLTGVVELPDSVILKGAGADSTILFLDHDSLGFSFAGSLDTTAFPLLQNAEKDSNWIRIGNNPNWNTNSYLEIHEDNGSWDINPAVWAEKAIGQIVKITAVSGDTFWLDQKLRTNLSTTANAEAMQLTMLHNSGMECLKIIRLDSVYDYAKKNIWFQYARQCRIAGIESEYSSSGHCIVTTSTNIEISGNYFHDAFDFSGVAQQGYGVALEARSGLCLIENNIFQRLRHAMMVKVGANGNVFGYNYSQEAQRSEGVTSYSGDISLHGHWPFANLFEGNIFEQMIADHFWGPNGQHNTFHRNRARQYGLLITDDTPTTSNQSFTGNEIPKIIADSTDYNLMVGVVGLFYSLPGSGHFEYGNAVGGTYTPTNTTLSTPFSYYHTSQPDFWDSSMLWPAMGLPAVYGENGIPAEQRFLEGNQFTVCPKKITPIGIIEHSQRGNVNLYPNPSSGTIHLVMQAENPVHKIIIRNSSGAFVKLIELERKTEIDVFLPQVRGLYFIEVWSKESLLEVKKVVKH